jgi:hypothetical protein
MKSDNQILLKEKERMTPMNTKLTADQRIFGDLRRYWQSEAKETKGRIDRMASENERLYSRINS